MKHIDYRDRIIISTLYNTEKRSLKYIADVLGYCERTIRNEIKRGLYVHRRTDLTESLFYSPEIAQKDYNPSLTVVN